MIQRIKGTQDLLDLTLYNFLITAAKKHLATYNFQEIITPILEPVELFKRSLGLATDVVSKEMYTVNTGHGEENICLRPEATASTVRAFLNNGIDTKPWKVFSYGPMFRHERPQKGRYRQFNQITIEILGAPSIIHDMWLLCMLDRFFQSLKINSYNLLLNFLGCAADRAKFHELLHKFLEQNKNNVCSTCIERKEKNVLRVFDCKSPDCQLLYKTAPKTTDYLCSACTKEWDLLRNLLTQLSVSYTLSSELVRGLDYYTKTVFEFTSSDLGAQSTFCGGGRYDGLAQMLGAAEPLPSLGAALGIERVLLLLEKVQDKLSLPHKEKLFAVLPYSAEQYSLALLIADQLQAHGLPVEPFIDGDSFKSMMRHANKIGATACIILGPEEQAANSATVKNMASGSEAKIPQKDLVSFLSKT